jgi:biopolymer transport protein ExbD
MNVNLPKASMDTIKREQTRTVSVDRQGKTFLNDVPMTTAQLRAEFGKLARSRETVTILLKADEANNYGAIMDVLKELHAAKITRIALMTQEEGAPRLARR